MKRIKKKLLPLALALAMCLGMCHGNAITAQAAGPAVVLVAPGVYSGVIDQHIFSEGLMQVYDIKTASSGFVNMAGQLVIPYQYKGVRDFQDGVARVHLNIVTKEFISNGGKGKSYNYVEAFIDSAGQTLFAWDSRYGSDQGKGIYPSSGADFHEGLVQAYSGTTRKIGFMNKAGQLAVPCLYGEVKDFSDGLAAVYDKENSYWGYVDAAGNVALPLQYKDAGSFEDGYAPVQLADGSNKWILIDKAGRNVIPEGYEYYDSYKDWNNFKSNGGFVWIRKDHKYYLLDKAGGVTGPFNGSSYGRVQDGMVGLNGEYSLMCDTTGRPLFGGEGMSSISEGYGVPYAYGGANLKNPEYFFDREGNKINLPAGVKLTSRGFSEGFLMVFSRATGTERWGFANTAGQVVIPCTYKEVGQFSGGVAPVKNFADKWGLIDATGAEVLPLQYESIKRVAGATGVFFAEDGNGTGLVAAPTVYAANGAVVNYAAQAEVNDALNAGIATEALGGDYRNEITRAQLASEAVKLYEAASGQAAPAAGASPFSDVNDPAVTQAQSLGLIDGLPDGTFVPNATVPKEQAAAILSGVSAKVNGADAGVKAAKFEPEGSMRKTASIEETLATATRILKKVKK